MNHSARLLLFIALLGAGNAAFTKALRDPTRPLVASDANRVTDRTKVSSASNTVPTKPVVLIPQLQMVLISPTRRYVVIDGVLLSQGDDFNGLRLVEIRPDGAILRAAGGLRLLPLPSPDAGLAAAAVAVK